MEKLTKICTKCKTEKSITEFVKDKNKKDGFRTICKQCIREHREKNKDKINEYQKQYKLNNIEKIKESQKKYISKKENKIKKWECEKKRREKQEVKDRIKEKSKAIYNTDKAKEKRLKYYAENKERILERQKQKRLKDVENFKNIQKKYRQSEKGRISEKNKYHNRRFNYKNGDVTNEQLKNLYNTSKNCYWCGIKLVKENTHLDHYIPLSKGGIHTISNLVLACCKCNLKKQGKDPLQFAQEIGKLI